MNFDDLFTLLLFIVFIGLPLLNRLQQRGRGGTRPGAPPPGRAPRPGVPTQTPTASTGRGGDERRSGEGEPAPRSAAPRDDDPFAELAKRLEEARRRVREAADGSGSQSATVAAEPRRTIATPTPASAPLPDPRANAPRRTPGARDPFPKARQRPDAPWRRAAEKRSTLGEEAPALEVERGRRPGSGSERRAREVARLQSKDLVALDAQSFRKGIMWHMVLSGPVAHRNRRKSSPPASR